MAPIDPWRNFTPVFGAVAFCTTNIEDFRTPLTSNSLTISSTYSPHKRSLRFTSSKRKIIEVIEVDHLKDTNNKRLSWAMPPSGLKPKNENYPKEEDDLQWKIPFDGRQPLMKDDLRWKTTFDGRWPLIEDDIQWKTTFDGRRPLTEDDLWCKSTFEGRRPLTDQLNRPAWGTNCSALVGRGRLTS